MSEINFTIVKRRASLLIQFLVTLSIGWGGMIISKLIPGHPSKEFFVALVALIFFSIFNTVVSIANESYFRYTVPSYYIYILLVIVLFLSARYLSGISIWTLSSYRMMLFSVTIFYAVISVMVRGVRAIYDAAEKGIF